MISMGSIVSNVRRIVLNEMIGGTHVMKNKSIFNAITVRHQIYNERANTGRQLIASPLPVMRDRFH